MGMNVVSDGSSERSLEVVGHAAELPQVLLGHATPAIQEKVSRFYSNVHVMFEAWLARRQSPNTRRAYRRDVLDFVEFLGIPTAQLETQVAGAGVKAGGPRKAVIVTTIHPEHGFELLQATVPQVQAWRDMLQHERDAAPNTLNRRISSVSGFFRFMREAAAEARLPITVPNPAHSQFIR